MEPKPSLLSRMAYLFARDVGMYLGSLFLPAAMGIGSMLLMFTWLTSVGAQDGPYDPTTIWGLLSATEKIAAICGMLLSVWLPIFLASRGVVRIAASRVLDREIEYPDVVRDMALFMPGALSYTFIIGIPCAIGVSFLGIPSILVMALFTLVIPAGIVEERTTFGALKRGTQLSGNVYGRSFLLVLSGAVSVALLIFLREVSFPNFSLPENFAMLLKLLVIYLPALILLVLSNICFTLLYFDATSAPMAQPPPGAAAGMR